MGLHMKKDKKEETKIEKDANDSRIYEVGYLLVPSIPEEEVGAEYGNLKELISSLGGAVVSDEMPRMIGLAYQMSKVVSNIRYKYDNGYFGWTKFEMDPESVLELKKKLDMDAKVIRFLIIKTVRENTIASKRFIGKDMIRRKPPTKKEDGEPVAEINKEEIDKEIEALVSA